MWPPKDEQDSEGRENFWIERNVDVAEKYLSEQGAGHRAIFCD